MNKKYLCLLAIIILTDNNAYACRGHRFGQGISAWINGFEYPTKEEIKRQENKNKKKMMQQLKSSKKEPLGAWQKIEIPFRIHEKPDMKNRIQGAHPGIRQIQIHEQPEMENVIEGRHIWPPSEEEIKQQEQKNEEVMREQLRSPQDELLNSWEIGERPWGIQEGHPNVESAIDGGEPQQRNNVSPQYRNIDRKRNPQDNQHEVFW